MIERFFSESPSEILIYPKYGLKKISTNFFSRKKNKDRNTFQGKFYC